MKLVNRGLISMLVIITVQCWRSLLRGDVNATQQIDSGEATATLTREEAIALLNKIVELIKSADLPGEVAEEATKYVEKAKDEAEDKKPHQEIIVTQLERATSVIEKLDKTAGATQSLISKLSPHFIKIAGWLGLASHYFFG